MNGTAFGGLVSSAALRRREARGLRCGFVLLLVLLVVTAANAIFGVGGRAADDFVRNWLSSATRNPRPGLTRPPDDNINRNRGLTEGEWPLHARGGHRERGAS